MPKEALIELMGQPEYHYPGLESSVKSLEWLWNNNFAAVAGDNPGFEAWSRYNHDQFLRFYIYIFSINLVLD
jgi:hypothetical protein